MKTMTFQARELKDALAKVRDEMGPDALILSTREVMPLLGFGKPMMEVIAQAVEQKPAPQKAGRAQQTGAFRVPKAEPLNLIGNRVGQGQVSSRVGQGDGTYGRTGRRPEPPRHATGLRNDHRPAKNPILHREPQADDPMSFEREIADEMDQGLAPDHDQDGEEDFDPRRDRQDSAPARAPGHGGGRAQAHDDDDALSARLLPLQREVRALKSQIFQVSQGSAAMSGPGLKQEVEELRAVIRTMSQNARGPGEMTSDLARLLNLGVARSRAEALLQRAREIGGDPEAALRKAVAERVVAAGPVGVSARVAAFIGPTGVGKTTTIAKIAARASLIDGAKVALITVDTFRVGAIDQLQRYADLMELPLHVAGTSTALKAAVVSNAGADLILVDTAGRGPRDVAQLAALRELLGSADGVETHLCLAATTRAREQALALQSYRPLHPSRLCITKLDEAVGLGEVLNIHEACRLPISYFGTGQKVPEDLELCTPDSFAERLLKYAVRDPAPGSLSDMVSGTISDESAPASPRGGR